MALREGSSLHSWVGNSGWRRLIVAPNVPFLGTTVYCLSHTSSELQRASMAARSWKISVTYSSDREVRRSFDLSTPQCMKGKPMLREHFGGLEVRGLQEHSQFNRYFEVHLRCEIGSFMNRWCWCLCFYLVWNKLWSWKCVVVCLQTL